MGNEAEVIATEVDDEYLLECININPEDISGEFERIPGQLAYWNARYARALRVHLEAEINVKVTKARVYRDTREAIIAKGGKPTEEYMKSLVESNHDYMEEQYTAAAAEADKNLMYGKLDAIRSKKEMIISLGAHMRAEMGGDPLIREQAAAGRRHRAEDD